MACIVPAFLGACLAPTHRIARNPYAGTTGVYVEPTHDDGAAADGYAPTGPATRTFEATLGAFVEPTTPILGHSLDARAWLAGLYVHGDWSRFYEPRAKVVPTLDRLHLRVGSNLFGPLAKHVEVYPVVGAGLLRGARWDPSLSLGGEIRVYPWEPLAFAAQLHADVYASGNPIFETRVEAGLAFPRVELRTGILWVTQYRAASFVGPTLSLALRY
ncbi:MAG: hypothetical protein U0169_17225 [Polyangiaceae bacterium]